MYMAVVSVAIVISFDFKREPSQVELHMAKPMGIVFWLLSAACLVLGLGNYISEYGLISLPVWRRAIFVAFGSVEVSSGALSLVPDYTTKCTVNHFL